MTHKTNPKTLRMGITQAWDAKWLPKKIGDFPKFLKEDELIRSYLSSKFKDAGLSRILISRLSEDEVNIVIESSRPGLIIGRQGKGIEEAKDHLKRLLEKERKKTGLPLPLTLKLEVEEIKRGELKASIVAREIARQIEKRIDYKRVMKRFLADVMAHKGVKGCKIRVSGRLRGAEIARSEWVKEGRLPLSTLKAKIDYGFSEALCTYGKIGVKVWIYKE